MGLKRTLDEFEGRMSRTQERMVSLQNEMNAQKEEFSKLKRWSSFPFLSLPPALPFNTQTIPLPRICLEQEKQSQTLLVVLSGAAKRFVARYGNPTESGAVNAPPSNAPPSGGEENAAHTLASLSKTWVSLQVHGEDTLVGGEAGLACTLPTGAVACVNSGIPTTAPSYAISWPRHITSRRSPARAP